MCGSDSSMGSRPLFDKAKQWPLSGLVRIRIRGIMGGAPTATDKGDNMFTSLLVAFTLAAIPTAPVDVPVWMPLPDVDGYTCTGGWHERSQTYRADGSLADYGTCAQIGIAIMAGASRPK